MKSRSRVRLFATPWTAAYQAPPTMGFARQEYWSGVPLPSPLDSLPGNKPAAPALEGEVLITVLPGKSHCYYSYCCPSGTPLQYSCLENPVDRGAWWAAVHGVAKSWTRLSDFTFTFHFHALEKEMATHSSVLAWRIPGTGGPGGLPSVGSNRVGYD